jgi:lipid A 4'-phosphatase
MRYLKLRRSQSILLSFALFSVLLTAFPAIDLRISKIFFHANSFLLDQWWQTLLHVGLGYFLCASMVFVVALYAYNRFMKRDVCNVDGRRVVYLLLVLIVGAGHGVNVLFNDNLGRARPRDVAEFGGTRHFTPAFTVSSECDTNCSFSSGDAAGGFFSLALALALSRRRALFVAGIAAGVLVSFARISSGAHFFSDTVVSFFVMLIVADVLYYYVVMTHAGRDEVMLGNDGLEPAYATVPVDPRIEAARVPARRPV